MWAAPNVLLRLLIHPALRVYFRDQEDVTSCLDIGDPSRGWSGRYMVLFSYQFIHPRQFGLPFLQK